MVEGLRPNVPVQQGGYLIALRHPAEVAGAIAEASIHISSIIPAVVYSSANVHTSLSMLGAQENFSPEPSMLEALSDVAYTSLPYSGRISIVYGGLLANQNTVIAEGQPNEQFFYYAAFIVDEALQRDITLQLTWGSHITVARFLEQGSGAKIQQLLEYLQASRPLGTSVPESVDVGHFILSPHGFNYQVFEHFEIR